MQVLTFDYNQNLTTLFVDFVRLGAWCGMLKLEYCFENREIRANFACVNVVGRLIERFGVSRYP